MHKRKWRSFAHPVICCKLVSISVKYTVILALFLFVEFEDIVCQGKEILKTLNQS